MRPPPSHSPAGGPSPAVETPRQAIARVLAEAAHSAHELSALVHIPEKDVASHLEHLARSLRRHGGRLEVEPARCRDCDYVFRDRRRLSRPTACPRCDGEHLTSPLFWIGTRR
jgi:predicted Zn-ribbon and HTH transcriptional regulator